jgi:hypothetical protein
MVLIGLVVFVKKLTFFYPWFGITPQYTAYVPFKKPIQKISRHCPFKGNENGKNLIFA